MAVKVDYYKVLGIQMGATDEQITEAVRKVSREWRKRTESSDIAVRQEAELRVAQINEARAVLTDPQQRQAYDAQLQREGVEAPKAVDTTNHGGDWLKQANHFLGIGDYHSAAYAAREATQQMGNSAESWWIRSRANAGLERYEDAIYEAQQATNLETNNPTYHFHLGFVAENLGRYDQAIREYQVASTIDPTEATYQLSIGSILLDLGKPREALGVLEPVYARNPGDQTANFYLGMALIDCAEQIPSLRNEDSYVVAAQAELDEMRSYCDKAKTLQNPPPEVVQGVTQLDEYLARMGTKRFHVPFGQARYRGPVASAITACFIMFVLFLLGIVGASTGTGGGFLWFLICIGVGVGVFFLTWVPNWKVNSRLFD
ncbi:J domain-containing protein [Gordonia iterans]|uniref:J domain-containing protein n=1 Tax=Gordonia iterans TaxID=1004901 RepID=UPI00131A6FCC|nr:tetratricopeptide repeat protein [Gordonia iterans]